MTQRQTVRNLGQYTFRSDFDNGNMFDAKHTTDLDVYEVYPACDCSGTPYAAPYKYWWQFSVTGFANPSDTITILLRNVSCNAKLYQQKMKPVFRIGHYGAWEEIRGSVQIDGADKAFTLKFTFSAATIVNCLNVRLRWADSLRHFYRDTGLGSATQTPREISRGKNSERINQTFPWMSELDDHSQQLFVESTIYDWILRSHPTLFPVPLPSTASSGPGSCFPLYDTRAVLFEGSDPFSLDSSGAEGQEWLSFFERGLDSQKDMWLRWLMRWSDVHPAIVYRTNDSFWETHYKHWKGRSVSSPYSSTPTYSALVLGAGDRRTRDALLSIPSLFPPGGGLPGLVQTMVKRWKNRESEERHNEESRQLLSKFRSDWSLASDFARSPVSTPSPSSSTVFANSESTTLPTSPPSVTSHTFTPPSPAVTTLHQMQMFTSPVPASSLLFTPLKLTSLPSNVSQLSDIPIYFAFSYPYSFVESGRDLSVLEKVASRREHSLAVKESARESIGMLSSRRGRGDEVSESGGKSDLSESTELEEETSPSLSTSPDTLPHHLHSRRAHPRSIEMEDGHEWTRGRSSLFVSRHVLTHSLQKRAVDVVLISSFDGLSDRREVGRKQSRARQVASLFPTKRHMFVSARVHPGEVPSSHVLIGMLRFAIRMRDPRSIAFRRHFVLVLVPMINVDGCSLGMSRTDTFGQNLNRHYEATLAAQKQHTQSVIEPVNGMDRTGLEKVHVRGDEGRWTGGDKGFASHLLKSVKTRKGALFNLNTSPFPAVDAICSLLSLLSVSSGGNKSRLLFFIDLHAHASQRGCFFYGIRHSASVFRQRDTLFFSSLIAKSCPYFVFDVHTVESSFGKNLMTIEDQRGETREKCGRVGIWKQTGCVHSYTLECNYNSCSRVNKILDREVESEKEREKENEDWSGERGDWRGLDAERNMNEDIREIVQTLRREEEKDVVYRQAAASMLAFSSSESQASPITTILAPPSTPPFKLLSTSKSAKVMTLTDDLSLTPRELGNVGEAICLAAVDYIGAIPNFSFVTATPSRIANLATRSGSTPATRASTAPLRNRIGGQDQNGENQFQAVFNASAAILRNVALQRARGLVSMETQQAEKKEKETQKREKGWNASIAVRKSSTGRGFGKGGVAMESMEQEERRKRNEQKMLDRAYSKPVQIQPPLSPTTNGQAAGKSTARRKSASASARPRGHSLSSLRGGGEKKAGKKGKKRKEGEKDAKEKEAKEKKKTKLEKEAPKEEKPKPKLVHLRSSHSAVSSLNHPNPPTASPPVLHPARQTLQFSSSFNASLPPRLKQPPVLRTNVEVSGDRTDTRTRSEPDIQHLVSSLQE